MEPLLDLLPAEYPAQHAALLLPGVRAYRVQGVRLVHSRAPVKQHQLLMKM